MPLPPPLPRHVRPVAQPATPAEDPGASALLAISGISPTARRAPGEPPMPEDEILDPEIEQELAATSKYGDHDQKPSTLRDRDLPIALLILGFLLAVGQGVAQAGPSGIAGALIGSIIILAINTGLMLLGVLLAAKVAGICFGPLNQALLKLCAICVGPTTAGLILTHALGGNMAVAVLGWGVSIICYWVLISYLFRLDGAQTATCVLAIFLVRLVASVCVLGAMFAVLSSMFNGGPAAFPE